MLYFFSTQHYPSVPQHHTCINVSYVSPPLYTAPCLLLTNWSYMQKTAELDPLLFFWEGTNSDYAEINYTAAIIVIVL